MGALLEFNAQNLATTPRAFAKLDMNLDVRMQGLAGARGALEALLEYTAQNLAKKGWAFPK